MVTFVELAPGSGADDEPLPRRARPAWWSRVRYLVGLIALLGAVLVGDGQPLVRVVAPAHPISAGYLAAESGPCPHSVDCAVGGSVRPAARASYLALFPASQIVGGEVGYERSSGVVFYQRLDALGAAGQVITLVQQRIPGLTGSAGASVELTPGPPRVAVVTARRGPWLLTARLSAARRAPLPVLAARRWVSTAPLPQ